MALAYPLRWPDGWPRVPADRREPWRGGMNLVDAEWNLGEEIRRLGGGHPLITTGAEVRGGRRAEHARAAEPAVAAWFLLGGRHKVLGCDRYSTTTGNLRALARTIESLRALRRYGTTEIVDRTLHAFDALPPPRSCWDVLGLRHGAPEIEIRAAFRELARERHPDVVGGTPDAMRELLEARDAALAAGRAA